MPETTNGQAAALWGGLGMAVAGLGTAYTAWQQRPPSTPGLWIGGALIVLGLTFAIATLVSIYRNKNRPAEASLISTTTGGGHSSVTAGGNVSVGRDLHIGIPEATPETPDFQINGMRVLCRDEGDATTVFIMVEMINRGAPSAAIHWQVRYVSPSLDRESPAATLVTPFPISQSGNPPGSPTLTIQPADIITVKTETLLPRGGHVTGWLLTVVPGNRAQEIRSGAAALTISVEDYLGRRYEWSSSGRPTY